MPTVKRFFYVTSQRSETMHLLYGSRVEGSLTGCGRPVTVWWHWAVNRKRSAKPICKRCMQAKVQ